MTRVKTAKSRGGLAQKGRPLSQNTVVKLLDEIGGIKGYRSTLRKRAKPVGAKEVLDIEFRPDLIMKPAIGWRVSEKVVEVEANVNNYTVSKSTFSLLDHISRNQGAKGFLVVPSNKARFASSRLAAIKEIIRRLRGGGQGGRRRIPLSVLTFDQVKRYHTSIHDYDARGRIGPPPKFQGFDD